MSTAGYLSKHYYTHDFLPADVNQSLLDGLLSDLDAFEDAKSSLRTLGRGKVSHAVRSTKTTDLPPAMSDLFRAAISAQLPKLAPDIGLQMRDDFTFEITGALHQDGGFFKPHIDVKTGTSDATVRYISAVYYLSHTPQQFSGGQFRLHALMGGAHQDFEAINNALMVFPSFAPHEVLPISVPSGRAEDGRFSINCWVRIPRPGA